MAPDFDPVRSGVIGGEGKDRIVVEVLELGGKIARAKHNVGLGIVQLVQARPFEAGTTGNVPRGGGHQLHQPSGTNRGDRARVKGTFLPDKTKGEIR